MTTDEPAGPLVFDPYDYALQDDPYPTYAGCGTRSRCTTTRSTTSG